MIRLGKQSIDIAPGDGDYVTTDSFVLPVDVDVHAVQPHAHYRAREVEGTAELPDGTKRPLIRIRDWDFRWQHVYRYGEPFTLPKGTTLSMRYRFDNSAGNPRNPQLPPARVLWGQRSRDEMGDLWLQVLPRSDRDLAALTTALRPKVLSEDVIGYEREIEREPSSVALHDDVAQLYLELGRAADAVRHFEASAKLNPSSAAVHFNLGTALTLAGRLDDAVGAMKHALSIRPDYGRAHNNLGNILLQRGDTAEALAHLVEAVRVEPSNIEAHYNLAAAHAQSGNYGKAVEVAEAALKLSPAEPMASALRERIAQYRQRRVR
jgi:tetratricopeptide (TPR) repeat protein